MDVRTLGAFVFSAVLTAVTGCGAPDNPGTSQSVPAPGMADPGPDPKIEETAEEEAKLDMTEFAQFDTDANGVIEEQEWPEPPPSGIEFAQIDDNDNGNIDRNEFRAAAKRTGGEVADQEVDPRDLDPTGARSP